MLGLFVVQLSTRRAKKKEGKRRKEKTSRVLRDTMGRRVGGVNMIHFPQKQYACLKKENTQR